MPSWVAPTLHKKGLWVLGVTTSGQCEQPSLVEGICAPESSCHEATAGDLSEVEMERQGKNFTINVKNS